MDDIEQLIRECARQNRLAQEKLYRKFYPALFLLCKRFFSDDHEALGCLNDGMLKVYTKIGKYKKEKGDFFNWVYTVVRNTALDRLRTGNIRFTEISEDAEISPYEHAFEALEWKDAYRLMDVLSPATRVVCSLFYFEGFSIKEISQQLQISAGTVKWHLSETRKKLKSVFRNHYS